MKISTVRIVRVVLLGVMLFFCLIGKLLGEASTAVLAVCAAIALVAFAADIVISILYWKCPGCGCPLRFKSIWPKYCSHCGEPLD